VKFTRARVGECLLQQLAEVEHLDAVVAQRLREPVVLLLGPVHPGDPVEQQLVVVPRGQPLELGARAVQQDRTEPAHLAVDVARHAATLSTRGAEDRLGHPPVRPGRLASMGLLDDKVVVVTGAGRGIGRGEALECARQGAAVVLNEFDPAVGAGVVDEIKTLGGSAVLVEGDVSDVAVADSLIATAVGEFGRLDGLVNNAGVLRDRTLAKMTPEEWDTVIRVHLRGHYAPTHAALVHWREHGGRAAKLQITFHGIPRRYFEAGDPYFCHCQKTARLMVEALGLGADDHVVTFQSLFGKEEWLRPYTDETMKRLGAGPT